MPALVYSSVKAPRVSSSDGRIATINTYAFITSSTAEGYLEQKLATEVLFDYTT